MNYKRYVFISALICTGMVVSCEVDESKFPLPYNDRTVGAYARLYQTTSNVLDFTDQANSAFEAVFEPVDEANGNNTVSIDFYVSFRAGSAWPVTTPPTRGLTDEVFVKSVPVSGFTAPPSPTYSVYKRGTIRVTMDEMITALSTALGGQPDPDGAGPIGGASPVSGLVAYPIPGAFAVPQVNDQFVLRWKQVLSDGREFTVLNPQNAVNAAFGNPTEENGTPNITTGQFYSSPFVFTLTVRAGLPATSWIGNYTLSEKANWSPSHSTALHSTHYPEYMNSVDFPDQTIDMQLVPGGLPSQRQFSVTYRGASVLMKINLEGSSPGASSGAVANLANTGLITICSTCAPIVQVPGLGMAGATTSNLGSVFIPLMNTGAQCTSERLFYWTTPATGSFVGSYAVYSRFASTDLPGLPPYEIPNRGAYRTDITGTTAGQVMYLTVDDDADEYGRRYGYCSFYRRIALTLTKQ